MTHDDVEQATADATADGIETRYWEPMTFRVGDLVMFNRRAECVIGHDDIPDRAIGTVVGGRLTSRLSLFDERRRSPNWNGGHTYPVQVDAIDAEDDFHMLAAIELEPISPQPSAADGEPGA